MGPAQEYEDPLDPEEARVRTGYGLLLGMASVILCCMPVGLLGLMFPMSVLGDLDTIEDEEEREIIRRRAMAGIVVCVLGTILSLAGYGFALIAGCD